MPRVSPSCVAIALCLTGQALAHECYWPECCIVGCFIAWELYIVPHLQETCPKTDT